MAEEAHGAEVQDRGMAVLAHPGRRARCAVGERRGRVVAVGALDGELGAAVERLLDPALRRRHADPEPVVLADEEDRERLPSVGEVRRGVERGLRGRVVQRGVAERAHDDRVLRPGGGDAELPRALDRERDPDGARQVRGDRRGLRDDREVVVAEDLVPAARDRLLGSRPPSRAGRPRRRPGRPAPARAR